MSLLQQAPHDLHTVRVLVDDYITRFYAAEIARAETISPDYARLWRVLHDTYLAGGKRLRPYMVVLAYRACKGDPEGDVLSAAAALELLHCSMLIHDDIIDRDIIRHGKPNVAGQYRSVFAETLEPAKRNHLADSAALLGGDLLIMSAHRLLAESKLPAEKRLVALRLMNDAIFNVVGGELLDSESAIKEVADADSLTIARYKTAHYSFVTPFLMGASLAGASQSTLVALTDYGDALGIAFQLADDLLGLFGDEEVTGKPATSDLREGRRTYLLQQAYRLASPVQRAELDGFIGTQVTVSQLERARAIVRECGAYDATIAEITTYRNKAHAAITRAGFAPEFEAECVALIDRATARSA